MKKLLFVLLFLIGCVDKLTLAELSSGLEAGWQRQIIASHTVCKGADGAHLQGNKAVFACEQGAKALYSEWNGTSWVNTTLGVSLQGPEDAILCDEDGDGDLDLLIAEQVGKRIDKFARTTSGWGPKEVIIPVTSGQAIKLYCNGPGSIVVGSNSVGASLDQWDKNGAGVYIRTQLNTAGQITQITPYDGTLLISDEQGANRGVYRLDTGYHFTPDMPYYKSHCEKDGQIATGLTNTVTGVSQLYVVGLGFITYPQEFSWYNACAWGDLDNDDVLDLVLTGTHSTDLNSHLIALLGPDYTTRIEIAGWEGIKESNPPVLAYLDDDEFLDVMATEEKSLGVTLYYNPLE